jgi:hypothetical protein
MKHIQLMQFKVQMIEIKQKCLLLEQVRGINFFYCIFSSNLEVPSVFVYGLVIKV